MTTFIIEDDKNIQDELKLLLSRRDDVVILGACTSIKSALEALPLLDVDLVLMDIELDDGKSFEILDQLNPIRFDVIFITAYDDFAIKAIKAGAIDYILKPIHEAELHQALDNYTQKSRAALPEKSSLATPSLPEKDVQPKKLIVRTLNEIYFIDIDQISHCKGDGNYTTFYTEYGKTITSSKPLREYYGILPHAKFIRTHQSYIVNKDFVCCYRNANKILMRDNTVIPVSFRSKEEVLRKLSGL